jgi:uncharacterized protein (TIGR00725 family)
MVNQMITIGVIGGGDTTAEISGQAYEVGRHIAQNRAVLVCGGLGGVMEAAAKGAAEHGGFVMGILPGEDKKSSNHFTHIAIPTGMGAGRNILVVRSSDAIIAFPGSYGTLSEIGLALSIGKSVVYMPGAWNLSKIGYIDNSLYKEAFDAAQAVGLALSSIN